MKLIGFISAIGVFLLPTIVSADALPPAPQVGDTYKITKITESAQGANGSSGSSHDKDTIIERVIGLRADGLEVEYDLPNAVPADQRASIWQLPVRLFKPRGGPAQLLNGPELETRLDGWLKAAKLPRTACGHWVFTWNAFRIECDPQSAIKMVEAFDLRAGDLREGASYQEADARAPGVLVKKATTPDGATFAVELAVDPDAVRRARADADVAVGEMMSKPTTLDAALRERAKENISGTISVTFDADATGNVLRRTKVTKVDTKGPNGSETETVTENLERQRVTPEQ